MTKMKEKIYTIKGENMNNKRFSMEKIIDSYEYYDNDKDSTIPLTAKEILYQLNYLNDCYNKLKEVDFNLKNSNNIKSLIKNEKDNDEYVELRNELINNIEENSQLINEIYFLKRHIAELNTTNKRDMEYIRKLTDRIEELENDDGNS